MSGDLRPPVTPEEASRILRLHHVEHWPTGTIATDLAEDYPVEERLDVRVGKTPYIRFDRNDYSVPHTHVRRTLQVLATDERVRVLDPEKPEIVIADLRRSFDRDQRVGQEGHVQALVEQKRRAHQSRGFDRLFGAVPSARTLMNRLALEGKNLGAATSGLLQLLDRVSAETLEDAVAAAIARDRFHLRAIHHEADRIRHAAGLPPPLSVPVTTDPRALDLRPPRREAGGAR